MSARVYCALACDDCGVLKVRALPADEPVRAVLSRLACGRCGSAVKLTHAPETIARRKRRAAIDRAYRLRHRERLSARHRERYQRWTPEEHRRVRERQRTPEAKAYFREYEQRPEVKARKLAAARARRTEARRMREATKGTR